MTRFMVLATFALALPEFVAADDPTVVYFSRPAPIGVNSHAIGSYSLAIGNFCDEVDVDSLELDDDGVDSASVTGSGAVAISTGSVTGEFYANVTTNAPSGASTISGSLSAESTTEANVDEGECITMWDSNEGADGHRTQADFSDTFTIDGEVPGTPVTIHSTVNIFTQVALGTGEQNPSIVQSWQFQGPGFEGSISTSGHSVNGTIEFIDVNGVPSVVDAIDLVDEADGILTISGTIIATYDSYVVGDTFSVDALAFADSWGIGSGSGTGYASGSAMVGWSATVVAQP